MKADRNLYLDDTHTIVVEESDIRQAVALTHAGCEIDEFKIAAHGVTVVDGVLVLPGAKAVAAAPEDKAIKAPAKTKKAKK